MKSSPPLLPLCLKPVVVLHNECYIMVSTYCLVSDRLRFFALQADSRSALEHSVIVSKSICHFCFLNLSICYNLFYEKLWLPCKWYQYHIYTDYNKTHLFSYPFKNSSTICRIFLTLFRQRSCSLSFRLRCAVRDEIKIKLFCRFVLAPFQSSIFTKNTIFYGVVPSLSPLK